MRGQARNVAVMRGNFSAWQLSGPGRDADFVNRFVPNPACVHCDAAITFTTCPTHWPMDTVAKVCYACGRVREYVDGLLIFTPREAVVEYTKRLGGVVKGGVAHATEEGEVNRLTVVDFLEMGFPAAVIAAELGCEFRYVEQIENAYRKCEVIRA